MAGSFKLHLGAFGKSISGMGAIEFALLAPLLLVLYVGCVDATRAITFHWKMQHATTAVNDLVSQATELTKDAVLESFSAADKMLSPFGVDDLSVRVTNVRVDENGTSSVVWSVTRGSGSYTPGNAYLLPDEMKSLRSVTLIVTETAHDYVPLIKSVLRANLPMTATARGRFRGRKEVVCANCTS